MIARARHEDELIHRDELRALIDRRGAAAARDRSGRAPGAVHRARRSTGCIPDLADRDVFICGPTGFTADVRAAARRARRARRAHPPRDVRLLDPGDHLMKRAPIVARRHRPRPGRRAQLPRGEPVDDREPGRRPPTSHARRPRRSSTTAGSSVRLHAPRDHDADRRRHDRPPRARTALGPLGRRRDVSSSTATSQVKVTMPAAEITDVSVAQLNVTDPQLGADRPAARSPSCARRRIVARRAPTSTASPAPPTPRRPTQQSLQSAIDKLESIATAAGAVTFRHAEPVMGTVVSFDVRPQGLPAEATRAAIAAACDVLHAPTTCSACTARTARSAGCAAVSCR